MGILEWDQLKPRSLPFGSQLNSQLKQSVLRCHNPGLIGSKEAANPRMAVTRENVLQHLTGPESGSAITIRDEQGNTVGLFIPFSAETVPTQTREPTEKRFGVYGLRMNRSRPGLPASE